MILIWMIIRIHSSLLFATGLCYLFSVKLSVLIPSLGFAQQGETALKEERLLS